MDLVTALDANEGVICVVGAGGKKTTLYRLAAEIDRAVVTATVRIPIFDDQVHRVSVTDDPVAAVNESTGWPIGVVPAREETRYRGYEPDIINQVHSAGVANVILVKADGARTRWLKAPNESEPRIPSQTGTVIPIASAKVVGKPLDEEYVHRPERVAELTSLDLGDKITPSDVATVLTSPDGGRKAVPDSASVIPLINMVDDETLAETARTIAHKINDDPAIDRIVLTKMIAERPVVAVID